MAYELKWDGNIAGDGNNSLSGYNNFRIEKTVWLEYDTPPTEDLRATVYMKRTSSTTEVEVDHIWLTDIDGWSATLVITYDYGWKDFFDNVYNGGNARIAVTIDGVEYSTDVAYIMINKAPIITNVVLTSDLEADNSVFIVGVTHPVVSFRQTPQLGTTANDPRVRHRGETVTAVKRGEGWVATLPNTDVAGSDYVTIITTDSDNNYGSKSIFYYPKEHGTPSITYNVFRCDSNGDRDMDGGYFSVTVWATANPAILPISFVGVHCESDETNPVVIADDGEGGFLELNNGQTYVIGNGLVDADTSYSMTFKAVDGYESDIQIAYYIPVVNRIINVKRGGTGIAFGKRATEDKVIGKPDDWVWEGINEGFDSTGWTSATGTSGAITVKTWNITEDGVYAINATSYQTRNNYTAAQQATMNSSLVVGRYNSSDTALETYSQRSPLTGGGDCMVSAMFRCTAGETIKCKVQQFAGSSGATLSSQTFYVRSSIIKLV